MAKRVTRYFVRVSDNVGGRRRILPQEFKTKAQAKKLVKKINSPAVGNRTRWRDAQSGTGMKNPRIIKRKVFR